MNALLRDRKFYLLVDSSGTPLSPYVYQNPYLNISHQPRGVHDSQAPNSVYGVVQKTKVNSEVQSADVPSTFSTAVACVKGFSRLCHAKTALYLGVAICR